MARKKSSTSIDEQLKRLDEANARTLVNQMNRNERNFSTMLDRQQEMLTNFYKASTEAGRESVRKDMENRRQQMQEQLDAMKKSYSLYSQYMTRTERKTFQVLYKTSQDGMASIEKEMKKRFDGLEDDFDELTESFSEKINRISDELRDLGTALNINEITQGLQETVDSYLENLRQVRARTGDYFDENAFSDTIDELNKSIGAINRSQASETVSNIIKDFGMKKMDEVSYYAKTMASAEVLGISKDEMSNIMWKDINSGKNGRFLKNINNMAISLGDNRDLYVHADTILSAINQNMDAIYGLSYKDSKKQTQMVTTLAAIEALSESSANEGVEAMVDKLAQWQKLTLPELMEDDTAISFSNLVGLSLPQLQASLTDEDLMSSMIETFQSRLSTMGDFELNMWKEELGFDYVYQLKDIIGYESLVTDFNESVRTIEDSLNQSDTDPTLDLMTSSANETVNAIQELRNSLTSNPFVKFFERIADTFDISLANAANMAIIASTGAKGLVGLKKFLSSGKGLGDLTSIFSPTAGGGFISALKGVFSKGSSMIGTAITSGVSILPSLAVSGAGIYGMFSGVNAAKSAGSEWKDKNYGRSVAYGVDSATLVGAGATTAVSGGIGIAAGISAAAGGASAGAATLAALSAIPGIGWVAAGVLAVGLGAKTILDNTKKVNGFAKGLESMEDGLKISVDKIIQSQRDQLLSIKGFLNASDGSSEDLNTAVSLLIEAGISPEILERMNSVEELKNFTQELINASQSAQDFADLSVKESVQSAVDELKYQFDDNKRQEFIDTSVNTLLANGSAKEGTLEWDKVNRFFESLADTMEEGDAKDSFVKSYKSAMESHGGISSAEMRALLGDKGASASWRAFWSTGIDLKDSYFDNATDYSKYNAIVDEYLGGSDSLRIDTSKIDAITANTDTTAQLDAAYYSWKNNKDKNVDVAEQYKYQFNNLLEEFKTVPDYDEFFKGTYEGYAREMGIQGYKEGLSNVPNDGLAYLHQGEAVLTKDQANVVRANADGGIKSLLEEGYMRKLMQDEIGFRYLYKLRDPNESSELNTTNSFLSYISPIVGRFMTEEMSEKKNSIKDFIKTLLYTELEWFSLWKDKTALDLSTNEAFNETVKKNGIFGRNSGGNSVISRLANALGMSSSNGSYATAPQGSSVINGSSGAASGGYSGGTGGTASLGSGLDILAYHPDPDGSGVERWRPYAVDALKANGLSTSDDMVNKVMTQIRTESSGDPRAINTWDSNAAKGTPSKGLLQTIDSTFQENKFSGHDDIWNGYDNMLAAINYAKKRYGNGTDIMDANGNGMGSGHGYAVGTPWLPNDQVALVHEGEMIVPADVNPLNNPSVSIPVSQPTETDNSYVIDTLKWMLYRLEDKFDKLIALQNTSPARRKISTEDVDKAYSFV